MEAYSPFQVDYICNVSGAQATITNIYIIKRFLACVSI